MKQFTNLFTRSTTGENRLVGMNKKSHGSLSRIFQYCLDAVAMNSTSDLCHAFRWTPIKHTKHAYAKGWCFTVIFYQQQRGEKASALRWFVSFELHLVHKRIYTYVYWLLMLKPTVIIQRILMLAVSVYMQQIAVFFLIELWCFCYDGKSVFTVVCLVAFRDRLTFGCPFNLRLSWLQN